MKRVLVAIVGVVLIVWGGYYGMRLWPLVVASPTAGERVVLLHGLGRNARAMLLLESALTEAGYEVHNIGYPSKSLPPEALIGLVAEEVKECCAAGDQRTHFVGHSLGGLLIRGYLAEQRPARLGRVVQLGSPNAGSEVADVELEGELDTFVREYVGPAGRALTTAEDGFPASLPPPDYPLGVIAGTRSNPLTDRWLPSPNDGLVSLASASATEVTDLWTVDASHWQLRNRKDVAERVVAFLRTGAFAD